SDEEESAFAAIAADIQSSKPAPTSGKKAPKTAKTQTVDDADTTHIIRSRVNAATTALVMDDVISEVTELYLDQIDPEITKKAAPPPSTIKRDLISLVNQRFEFLNVNAKGHDRITR